MSIMVSPSKVDAVILKAEELPSLSTTALKLIKMLDNLDVARIDVAETVSLDEVLAASIFKYANSAAVGARVKFTNLIAVIDYIGLVNIKNIVMMAAAKQVIKDEKLWLRSVFISNSVKRMGVLINESREFLDSSFLLALFHNLGSLVFRIYYAEEYKQCCSEKDFQLRLSKERRFFGIDHLELGATVLDRWKFPRDLIDLVKSQADIKSAEFTKQNTLIEIARCLFELEEVDQANIDMIFTNSDLKKQMRKHGLNSTEFKEDFVNELFDEAEARTSIW